MTQPILSVRDLNAYYGSNHALKHVDLDIAGGGIFAILGPSGSGKSTLLRVIAGFESASSGEIQLEGEDLLAVAPHHRPVGLMFQSYALFPHMSIAKNIAFGLESEKLPKPEVQSRVQEALEMIGLADFAQRRPAQLSGGQRQRVALARALVKRPKILLLDEPLSALDRQIRAEMQTELKRMQREMGMTFVIVTHDQEEAMSLADRVALLKDGAIEQVGSPTDLYERPETRFSASFIGSATLLTGSPGANGVAVPGFGVVPAQVPEELLGGSEVLLVVRPEHVQLNDAGTGAFQGVFESSSYLGGLHEAEIRVGKALVRVRTQQLLALRSGDPVDITFPSEHVRVIAAD